MTLNNAESVGFETMYSENITDNPYVVSWESGTYNVSTNGTIVKLTFAIKSDVTEGEYPITISYDEDDIYNLKEENVQFEIVNGSVKVSKHTPGDINNDGKVNMKDLTRLHQYINGWKVSVVESAIDVNGDGKVNMKDLTRLHQYINGWKVKVY